MTETKTKMFGYDVEKEEKCIYSNFESYGDGEYDSYSEEGYAHDVKSVSKTNQYPDLFCRDELKVGDKVFIVYALYRTGGTFGHTTGNFEPLILTKSIEEAKELKQFIKEDIKENSDSYHELKFKDYKGIYTPWKGYFESLESIEIEEVRVV